MRILLFGLTVFTLTVAFSFWHGGRHVVAPVTRTAPEPYKESPASPRAVASNPIPPAIPPAAAVAMTPSPPLSPTEMSRPSPDATPDDESRTRAGRATERGSRTR